MNIIIAGYGRLGKEIVTKNIDRHHVIGIKRKKDESITDIEQINLDITNLQQLNSLDVSTADILIYSITPNERTAEAYKQAYVLGLKNIVQSPIISKNTIVIFISSTSVYGSQNYAEKVNEETIPNPQHFNGSILLEAEEYLKNTCKKYYIFRFSGIYDNYSFRLLKEAQSLKLEDSHKSYFYTNRIHLEDCARMVWHCIDHKLKFGTYLGVDHDNEIKIHVLNWIRAQLNLSKIAISVSQNSIKNKRCSNKKIISTSNESIDGFEFKYPTYKEGYLNVVKQYKSLLIPTTTKN